jgi:hypothetical protein
MPTDPNPPPAEARSAVWLVRVGWLVLLVALGKVLITAVRLFNYAGPVVDDMVRAGHAHNFGVWRATADSYLHWSGRWSGVGTSIALGWLFDFRTAYGPLLVATQILLPISVYALLSAAAGDRLSRRVRVLLSLGLVALHWAGVPSLIDSYNWLTGAVENHLSLSLILLILAGLIRASAAGFPRWAVAVLAAVAVYVTGMHELYGACLCAALTIGAALTVYRRLPGRGAWAVVTAGAVAGFAFVVFSPGNAHRLATEHPRHDLATFRQLADHWRLLATDWVLDLKLLLTTMLVVCHPLATAAAPAWLRQWRWQVAAAAAVGTVGFLATIIVINWWTFPTPLPPRTHSGVYLVFLLGWFLTAFAVCAGWESRAPRPVWAGLAGCFAVALLGAGNYRMVRAELVSGRAAAFRAAVRERDRLIRAAVAAGDRNPRVPPIPVIPPCFSYGEVVEEQTHAHTAAYRLFYGLDSIHLRSDGGVAAAADGPTRR